MPVAQAPAASSTPGEGPEAISPVINIKDYETATIENSYLDPSGRDRYLFRPEEAFEEAYPGAEIQQGVMDYKKPDGRTGRCAAIDNDGYVYMVFDGTELNPVTGKPYGENEQVRPAEWGMYNLNTGEYTPCVTLQEAGHQIGEIVASDDYVVWHEDESNYAWVQTQWHIYSKRDKSDEIFYTPSRDPETNTTYKWNFNTPIILDDMVYFDDVQGYDKFAISLLSYDIRTKEIKTIAEPAGLPMIYEGKIAWLEPAEKKDNTKTIFRTAELSRICAFEDADRASASGSIIAISDFFNGNVEEETKDGGKKGVSIRRSAPDDKSPDIRSYYAVKIFDGKKIIPLALSEGNYIDWPKTNGRWVVWNDSCASDIRFYDASLDKIVRIENSGEMAIYPHMSDNCIVFTNNKNRQYCLINLGELDN